MYSLSNTCSEPWAAALWREGTGVDSGRVTSPGMTGDERVFRYPCSKSAMNRVGEALRDDRLTPSDEETLRAFTEVHLEVVTRRGRASKRKVSSGLPAPRLGGRCATSS